MASDRLVCVVLGAGGHGKVVADAVLAGGGEVTRFIDAMPDLASAQVLGIAVTGEDALGAPQTTVVAMGIGQNEARRREFLRVVAGGFRVATVIHPSAVVGREVTIGAGSVVFARAVVNPGTAIGENAIINTSASIDHDCVIGAHAHIAPGSVLAGGVIVGEQSFLGAGTIVLPGVRIGAHVRTGAGAVVTEDLPDHCLAVGVPARIVR